MRAAVRNTQASEGRRDLQAVMVVPILFLLFIGITAPTAQAQPACESEYDLVRSVLRMSALPQRLSHRIDSKLASARSKSQAVAAHSIDQGVKQLDTALELLGSKDMDAVPPDLVEAVHGAITRYRDCASNAPPARSASIRVVVSRQTTAGTTEVVAGARVRVDRELAGVTGKDGSLTLTVPADRELHIGADDRAAGLAGERELTAAAGSARDEVTIALGDGLAAEPNELELDEISAEGLLPHDFSALTLHFIDDEKNVAVKSLGDVQLRTQSGYAISLNSMFSVNARGEIVATKPDLVRKLILGSGGELSLYISAYDSEGLFFDNFIPIEVGIHRLTGRLVAPPSMPALDTGKVAVELTALDGRVYRALSDGEGNFNFGYLPSSVFDFEAIRTVDGVDFKATGSLHIDSDKLDVTLPMMRYGEPLDHGASRNRLHPSKLGLIRPTGADDVVLSSIRDTTANKCAIDGRSSESLKLCPTVAVVGPWFDIPQGTGLVHLRYQVTSDETVARATVAGQPYRDTWGIGLRIQSNMSIPLDSTGDTLHANRNGDMSLPGTSKWLEYFVDATDATKDAPLSARMEAQIYNCCIGDNTLQSQIYGEIYITRSCPIPPSGISAADITCPPTLSVSGLTPDSTPIGSYGPSNNDGNVYSIPRIGKSNHYQRSFTATIHKTPADAPLTGDVTLFGATFDEQITDVRAFATLTPLPFGTDQYRVTVTYVPPDVFTSPLTVTPPPAHFILYRFHFHVDANGKSADEFVYTAPSPSKVDRALWRMPDIFSNRRFGGGGNHANGGDDDVGGDNWASRGAYEWMERNEILLTRINDISGEHGVNLHHNGHAYGTDIDIYHFGQGSNIGGDPSGQSVYDALKSDAQTAQGIDSGNPTTKQNAVAAIARLGQWVQASRDGIANLLALPEVSQVGYIVDGDWEKILGVRHHPFGCCGSGLLPEWGKNLLQTGKIVYGDKTVADTHLGDWPPGLNGVQSKMRYWAGHWNHIHITLNRCIVDTEDTCPLVSPALFCSEAAVTSTPASVTIESGQSTTLSVGVSGDGPFSYQWYAYPLNSYDETALPNSNSPSITVSPTESMIYRVAVSNGCGDDLSAPAVVTVLPACVPAVIASSPSGGSIVRGATVMLSVIATGDAPLSYQWFYGATGDTTAPVPNSSDRVLTVAPTGATTYWVRVTNSCGTANSVAATVDVQEQCIPITITGSPASRSINAGESAILTVLADGTGRQFAWFIGAVGDESWPVAGSNTDSIFVSPLTTTDYWVRVSNACGTANSAVAHITVIPPPACTPPSISTQSQGESITLSEAAVLSVVATGSAPLTVQWFTADGTAAGFGATTTVHPAATTTYHAHLINPCGAADSAPVTIIVAACSLPSITTQPASVSIVAGTSTTLSIATTPPAGNVSYQWYNGAAGDTSAPLGTNAATFTTPVLTGDAQYWVRLRAGTCTLDSDVATVSACSLTVSVNSVITRSGQLVSLTASVFGARPGGDILFEWFRGTAPDTSTPWATGAYYPSIQVSPLTTTSYWVRVSDGTCSTSSNTAVVSTCYPTITAQPQSILINSGMTTTLSASVTGDGLTYQWYLNSGTAANPVGTNSSMFTTPPLTTDATYWVRVTGCGLVDSSEATVSICQPPHITNTYPGAVIQRGTSGVVSVGATGTDLTYQWYAGTAGDTSTPLDTLTSHSANMTVAPYVTSPYWARVSGLCGDPQDSATVLVSVCPQIFQQPAAASGTVMPGTATTLTASGTDSVIYQWYQGGTGDTSHPFGSHTLTVTTPPVTADTMYWLRLTSGLCTVASDSVTVHLCALNEVHWASFPHPLRAGEPFTMQIMAQPDGAQLYWYRGVSGDVEHSTLLAGPVDTSYYYQVLPDTPTATYWVRVKVGDCYADSSTLTLTVCVPTFTQQPVASPPINVGGSTTLSVAATPAALTYQWYTGDSGDDSHPITGATSASYIASPAADTSYWVRVTGSCGATANSDAALVTVCQVPHINANPTSTSVPHGGVANLAVFATGSNLTYQWYAGTAPDTSTPIYNLTSQSAVFTINPGVTTSYWVRVSGSCGTAQNSTTATVSVCPLVLQQPAAAIDTVMSGSTTTLTAAGSEVPVYRWYQGEVGDTSHPFGGNTATVTTPAITAETKFWVMLSSGSCSVNSDTVTVHLCNISEVHWASFPHPLRLGEPFTLQIMSPPDGAQLYWYRGASGDVAHSTLLAGPIDTTYYFQVLPDTPTATYWVRVKVGDCYADSSTFTLVVCVPMITQQPVAPPPINVGGSATLSVVATPAALTYQWYTGASGDDSHPIANATSASYTASPAADTSYWVRVTGSCGATADSDSVLVTVCQIPHINANPTSTSVPHGGTANLGVSATGSNLTYQWYAGTAPDTSTPIYNLTSQSAIFTINPGVTTSYWVRVSGSCGTPQNSTTATVSVCPLVLQQPVAAIDTVMSGSTATLTASGSEGPVYHWYQGETGDTSHPFGGNTATVTTPAITAETKFWVMLSSGSCSVNSDTVTVHLCALGEVHWASFPHPLHAGEPFTLQIMSPPDGAQLYWYRGVSGDVAHSTLLAGPIDTSYYYQVLPNTPTSTYWVRVKQDLCYVDSSTLTLFVCVPTITQPPADAGINPGGSATLTVAATPSDVTYQWYTGETSDVTHPVANATSSSYAAAPAADTRYWVRVSGSSCGATADSTSALVTVCQLPHINAGPSSASISYPASANLGVFATGSNLTYQWYSGTAPDTSTPINNLTSQSATLTIAPWVTTSYWVRVSGQCGTPQNSATVTVHVCMPPAIATQPQSSSIFSGATTTLNVTATEGGVETLHYQWYRGAAGDGSSPVGTDAPAFTTPALTQDTSYWVRVSCLVCSPVDSNVATVSICMFPQILGAPGDQFIAIGHPATLTTASGGSVYQWYSGASGDTSHPASSPSMLPSFTVYPSVTTQYWAQIQNGGCVTRTQSATVYVCIPTITTDLPASLMINTGTSTTLTIVANTSGLSYQWYRGATGDTSAPVGTNSASFTTPALTTQTSYWVRVTGSCGQRADSSTATISICYPPAIASTAVASQSMFLGSTTSVWVSASGNNLTYQWYIGASGNTTIPYGGAGGTTNIINVTPSNTTSYWVRVSGSCGASVNSTAMVVNVCASPSITAQPQGTIVFSGATATMSVTVTEATTTAVAYQWYRGVSGDTSAPVGTNSASFTTPALTTVTNYWVRISCGVCAPADSQTATVQICYNPQVLAAPAAQSIAIGQSATLTAPCCGNTYQWFLGASGVTTQPVTGTSNVATFTASPSVTTQYWAQVVNNGCVSRTQSASINVCIPTFTQSPASITIAGGSSTTLTASANTPGVTYQWYVGASGVTSSPIAGATGSSVTVTPGVNTSYWVRATGSCGIPTDSTAATVTLCSPPVITGQPVASTLWGGGTAYFWVYTTGSNLTFQWYYGNSGDTSNPIGGANASTGSIWIWTTTKIWVRVTGQCGAVNSNATFASIYPSISQQPPDTINVGYNTTATISFSASSGNYTSYIWKSYPSGTVIATTTIPTLITPVITANTSIYCEVWSGNAYTTTNNTSLSVCYNGPNVSITKAPNGACSIAYTTTYSAENYEWYQGARGDTSHLLSSGSTALYVCPTVATQYWLRAYATSYGVTCYSDSNVVTLP